MKNDRVSDCASRSMSGRNIKSERAGAVLLFFAVMAGWEYGVRFFDVSSLILPTPSATVMALWDGLASGSLVRHFGITFYETLAGFLLGSSLGLLLGGVIGQFGLMERVLYPYIVAFQTIPKVAIAPLIVIWFGYGVASKVVITATIAFFPVLANTIVGLHAAPREQLELLIAFDGSRWQAFRMVKIPNALPYVFVGLDVAVVLSVIGAIVGEFVGSEAGLGYLILQRNFSMDTAGVFAILIVLSLMGVVLHGTVQWLHRKCVFWSENAADRINMP